MLTPCQLKQVTTDNGRYYETPEGLHYPSVTTVLSKRNHSELQKWKEAVGEDEAKLVSKRASTRGTQLHENVEYYLKNEKITIAKNRLIDVSLMKSIIPHLTNISNIKLQESPLYSHSLKLAGTLDLFADWCGVPSVIDFKTSSKIKNKYDIENYFIQTAIYAIMINERYGFNVNQLVILIAQEFGDAQVFIEQRKNWFKQIKELL